MPFETRHVEIAGRRTRVLEAGRGAPLVLIHAFPLSADLWAPQLESPPAGWRLIAPDLRGFGGPASAAAGASAQPLGDLSLDDYAADVEALVAALGLRDVVLGGLSMGGYVIFAVWRRAKLRLRGLVLADTRAQADTEEGRAGRRKMQALADAEGAAGVAREMLPKLVGETTRRTRPEVVERVRHLIEAHDASAIKAALGAMMGRPDSTALLASIAVPALVVVGEEDVLTPPANAEELHRGLRESKLVRIPRAGHLSSLERPDAFNAALASFLGGAPL